MALTTQQTGVRQKTRIQIIVGGTPAELQTEANSFITGLESSGISYAINVGDPFFPAEGAGYWLRITYTSLEYLIEEPAGV